MSDKEREIAEIIIANRESRISGNSNLKQIANKVVNSKEFKEASDKGKEVIIHDLMITVFNKTKGLAVREYGSHRFCQTEFIKAVIYSIDPPKIDYSIK